ncbi:asparaginase [Chachezhania antarctica]|uniref:asparaginase n=1 Tax=Chachezhania antarctica TaxID=2340860 RepID=UPI001F0980C5|nr:asparaginase [Chachezhania antarctica]
MTTAAAPMVEVWRGDLLESLHCGHAAICDDTGQVIQAWGDVAGLIYPRSSCKMIQALPLLASGAAEAQGLGSEHLALTCASHQGAAIHTTRVQAWLKDLGLGDDDLRCGPQEPPDRDAAHALIRADAAPCQYHNNCSGKHSGFLTLNRHLGTGPDYVEPDHPVQKAVRAAFEDVTDAASPGYGIDGCSAPNFQTTVQGLARAMSWFATASDRGDGQSKAAVALTEAMMRHPELVAGEGRACTRLMRLLDGRGAVKTGAEGVFVAILPQRRMGIALKIADGATRASESAITALLVALGELDADNPEVQALMSPTLYNRRGIAAARVAPVPALLS